MRTILTSAALLLLGGFAFGATGCVTEYQTVSTSPTYSGTTLPAASRVALVMEFRGGTPSPQERAEVRALLADYLAGKGSVLVEDPGAADYLVHVVLERRNPASPEEWTVVDTSSACSLRSVYGDDYSWPGGIVEDDTYETTTYSYIGFGAFYPIWFDAWDGPWHRGRIHVFPPPHRNRNYGDIRWLEARRHHQRDRWQNNRGPARDRRDDDHRDTRRNNDADRRDHDRRPDVVRSPENRDNRRDADRDHGANPPRPNHNGPVAQPGQPPRVNPAPAAPPQVRPQTPPPSRREPPREINQPQPRATPPGANRPEPQPRTVVVPGRGPMIVRPGANPPAEHREQPKVQPNPQGRPADRGPQQMRDNPPPAQPHPVPAVGPNPSNQRREAPNRPEVRRADEPRKVVPQPKRDDSRHDRHDDGKNPPKPKDDSKDHDKDDDQRRH
jgi:hypothetical protein